MLLVKVHIASFPGSPILNIKVVQAGRVKYLFLHKQGQWKKDLILCMAVSKGLEQENEQR